MSEQLAWTSIGYGSIGQEVGRQLGEPDVAERYGLEPNPTFIVRKDGVMDPDGETPFGATFEELCAERDALPPVAFVSLPSTDDGELAMRHITPFLGRDATVVTAEKGALANNFEGLKQQSDNFKHLGFVATVGGGTRMLKQAPLLCLDQENVTQIHMALNGTLTFVMSSIAQGMSLGQAVHQAVELKYAEPGASSPDEVIRQEAEGDIPKKVAILFNTLGLGDTLDWKKIDISLNSQDINQAVEEASVRRFIISLYSPNFLKNHFNVPEQDVISKFETEQDGWRIVCGFRHMDRNPLFARLGKLTGTDVGMMVGLGPDETDGAYPVGFGPGAGARPTVNAMLDDYKMLRANQ